MASWQPEIPEFRLGTGAVLFFKFPYTAGFKNVAKDKQERREENAAKDKQDSWRHYVTREGVEEYQTFEGKEWRKTFRFHCVWLNSKLTTYLIAFNRASWHVSGEIGHWHSNTKPPTSSDKIISFRTMVHVQANRQGREIAQTWMRARFSIKIICQVLGSWRWSGGLHLIARADSKRLSESTSRSGVKVHDQNELKIKGQTFGAYRLGTAKHT